MTQVTCLKCQAVKPASDFSPQSRKRNGLRAWCKPCTSTRQRELMTDDRRRRYAAQRRLKTFGLRACELTALRIAHGDLCAICAAPFAHIDHNHATGAVRGLLCNNCNLALGLMRDDPSALRGAAEYVETR